MDKARDFFFFRSSNISNEAETTYYVNVCDIDSPWEVHQLTSSQDAIALLRWDSSATRLLLITALGKCQIWEMKVIQTRRRRRFDLGLFMAMVELTAAIAPPFGSP